MRVTFIFWIIFIPLRAENKLKFPEKLCKNKDFCRIVMPSEKGKISEFNQYVMSDKIQYIIYVDVES